MFCIHQFIQATALKKKLNKKYHLITIVQFRVNNYLPIPRSNNKHVHSKFKITFPIFLTNGNLKYVGRRISV